MKLSKRLETVASFVTEGSSLADIGTDHGYIPIWLAKQGVISRGLAMDVRPGPLKRAEDHIREQGLSDRIGTRLGDGMKELRPGEADCVVIAGMGGELMIRILNEGRHMWDSVKSWVLSPQSDLCQVRMYLEKQAFSIVRETMIKEDGKFYTVMEAARELAEAGISCPDVCGFGRISLDSGEICRNTGADIGDSGSEIDSGEAGAGMAGYKYGRLLIRQRDPVLREYLEQEKRALLAVLDRLDGMDTDRARARRAEIEKELSWIGEAEDEMR